MHPMPKPYSLLLSDATLTDLRDRLARTRLPETPPQAAWATGTSVAYMADLVRYWRDEFDWRKQEVALNRLPQFTVPIDGIDLHFVHVEGKGSRPQPLLLSHGWPGSFIEFHKVIPMLTDPARFGGDPADAFTVVAPSLPGYTLSFQPGQPRFGAVEIAATFARLMTEVLGYQSFAAQGGDWGAFITARLAHAFPQHLAGIHLNLLPVRRDPKMLAQPKPEEMAYLAELDNFMKEEMGYQWIQGTKPTTLSFALNDSPLGLAAWIAEKFHAWTDNEGTIESAISRDEMLTNITLYWATGSIGSSFWPYYARMRSPWPIPEDGSIKVPTGYAEFPKEILHPPRSLAERYFGDLRRWTKMKKGGHFAALEQPEALVHEIREFFRPLR